MPISLTRFSPGILTDAQLNALVDAITAKFNAGITGSDLAWPFTVGGNFDMASFEILNLAQLWNVRNLAERGSATLQEVLTAVGNAGGGVVLLPANTTETIGSGGVTVGANTLVIGQGDTSIFALSTSAYSVAPISNAAAGNSGIAFVNLKFTDNGASGTVDFVALNRTTRAKFVDCWFSISNLNAGVGLRTDSTGSACLGTQAQRCQFDVAGSGVNGVFMEDVQRVTIDDCEFNITANNGAGVRFTQDGATSLMQRVSVTSCKFNHSTGTGQNGVVLTGTGATYSQLITVNDNQFQGGATNAAFIDVSGASVLNICGNGVNATSVTAAVIRVRTASQFAVDDNIISLTSTGIGILIGATARSGSVAACFSYSCSNNSVTGLSTNFAFCHDGTSLRATIIGNRAANVNGSDGHGYEIWSSSASKTFNTTISGNQAYNFSGVGTSVWVTYTDLGGAGTAHKGRAGVATGSYLILTSNNTDGTTFSDGTDADFKLTTDRVTAIYVNESNTKIV